ncbi:MAG: hypothetical protein A3B25_01910 [Candidatus Ryanbacteria bacterium RIFCSPLOWO2_01_FULL_48_26]|uniref:PDZ domain-containing protein n=1 Tax=Candidatus Ryanbacteria bacterium RIFCSPLOWO2_01_FULL_48_26 TaxID=1802126 RepID=A0A1G2GSC3_9BACT|nr:MAG: hypothetical protein A3B25_01910 [Candidatus Ryanbacteria bacterium RIFCSPLOWO2_01_FULL_48_26]
MLQEQITSTIEKVMPATVSIVITRHLEDLEKEMPRELYPFSPHGTANQKSRHERGSPWAAKIPKIFADNRGMIQVGGGSGFIVNQGGIILTNKHVVSDSKAEYSVITNDGRKFTATILSRDPINDVAILKIQASGLPVVQLGNAANLKLGEIVIATGNALGIFKNTVSMGIISGLSRSIMAQEDPKSPPQEMRGLIQTDAAINVGNSGGPLVNLVGQAIGINTAVVYGAQSISFAIPINAARRDIDDIQNYGRIRRPLLGVRYIMIDSNLKEKMNLPVHFGAMVIRETPHDPGVTPESPAEKAGLREKDIILEFNGSKLDCDHPIQDFLETMNVGDQVKLLVLRGEKKFDTIVKLSERI